MSISCAASVSAFLAVAMLLVVRESAVASSRSAMMRCDNDDAASDNVPFSYVLIYV